MSRNRAASSPAYPFEVEQDDGFALGGREALDGVTDQQRHLAAFEREAWIGRSGSQRLVQRFTAAVPARRFAARHPPDDSAQPGAESRWIPQLADSRQRYAKCLGCGVLSSGHVAYDSIGGRAGRPPEPYEQFTSGLGIPTLRPEHELPHFVR